MTSSPLHRLTRLELRRVRPQLVRSALMLAVIFGVLALTGRATGEIAVLVLLGMAMAFALLLPPNQLRDKLDGSMAFLLGLPVERSTLARARCLATGLVMIPGALFPVAAWSLAAPAFFPPGLSRPGLAGVALVSWSTLTAVSILLSALLVRFKMEQVTMIPFVIFLGLLFVLDPLLTPLLPDQAAVAQFLARPEAAILVEFGIVLGSAAVILVGYRLLRDGLENYQPNGASMTW